MSAHRHQATWRSITFNKRYLDNGTAAPDDPANVVAAFAHSDYALDSMNATQVSVADLREARQFLEGAEPNQAFEGVRLIELRGRIHANSHGDLEDKTWNFYEAFSPAACRAAFAANTPPNVGPFSFKRDSVATSLVGLPLRFYCRPGGGRPIVFGRHQEGLVRPFIARLIAYDPKAYDEALTTSADIKAGATLTNPGNLATDPLITIVLSAAGNAAFTINNTTTGFSMVFNLSAETAGTFVLDVNRGTFVKGAVNKLGLRVSGFPSALFLQPGANVMTFANITSVTSIVFAFRGAYA